MARSPPALASLSPCYATRSKEASRILTVMFIAVESMPFPF
jgi:hypothetical protein